MAVHGRKWKNSRGVETFLTPIPPLMLEGISQEVINDPEWGPMPTPPTYTETLPDGQVEVHVHSKDTLETDEEKAEWNQYEEDLARWNGEVTSRTIMLVIMDGVQVDPKMYADGSRWQKKMALLKKAVPEDEFERHIAYCKTEVLVTADDFADIMLIVMELSGVDRNTLAKANAAFRRKLQQSPV